MMFFFICSQYTNKSGNKIYSRSLWYFVFPQKKKKKIIRIRSTQRLLLLKPTECPRGECKW